MAIRKAIRGLSSDELEMFRGAISRTKALSDERGYSYFAGLHGLPLPSYCQHGTLLFLPWHRAYLYFLELALQDQVPDVSIPSGLDGGHFTSRAPTSLFTGAAR